MSKYKGDIADFPYEVVDWMLAQQEAQGNPMDVSVFEKDRTASVAIGGFEWNKANVPLEYFDRPDTFCREVISYNRFDLFGSYHPKKWECATEIDIDAILQTKPTVKPTLAFDEHRFKAACAAMTGLLSSPHYSALTTEDWFAAAAVAQADALIEALMKGKEQ